MARAHRALNRLIWRTDEKQRRMTAVFEAVKLGWGGITKVAEITGLSRTTIRQGMRGLRLTPARVLPEWNYSLRPHKN